jgi:hypothetical protein
VIGLGAYCLFNTNLLVEAKILHHGRRGTMYRGPTQEPQLMADILFLPVAVEKAYFLKGF